MPHAVPHFYQSSEQACGPVCLRMLATGLGFTFDEATVAQHCGMTPQGCTVQDLVSGAQAMGLKSKLMSISSEQAAITALSNSVPFVAMIDLSSLDSSLPPIQWHFIVALEIANDVVTYHDPADGPDRRAPLDDFLTAWATAGYGGVIVWTP